MESAGFLKRTSSFTRDGAAQEDQRIFKKILRFRMAVDALLLHSDFFSISKSILVESLNIFFQTTIMNGLQNNFLNSSACLIRGCLTLRFSVKS